MALGKTFRVVGQQPEFDDADVIAEGITDWSFNEDCTVLCLYVGKNTPANPPRVIVNIEQFATVDIIPEAE